MINEPYSKDTLGKIWKKVMTNSDQSQIQMTARRNIDEAIGIINTTVKPNGLKKMPVDIEHYLELLTFYRDNHPTTKGSANE